MSVTTITGAHGFQYGGGWIASKIITGTGTYTPSPGTSSIQVTCIGSGGGAGGVKGVILMKGASSGGGSGSFCSKYITPVAASYSYDVGLGGPGGDGATPNSGEDGSSTFFGGILTAPGGTSSSFVTADSGAAALTAIGAGPGTVGTGGDFNSAGLPGGTAFNFATLGVLFASDCVSGAGGDRPGFGSGGAAIRGGSSNGANGGGYGSGGGGATTNGVTSRDGGTGADGVILIAEYS